MKNLFNYFKNGNYSRGIIIHLNISFPQNVKRWPFANHLGIKSHFGTGQTQTLRAGGAPRHGNTPAPPQPSCPERGQAGGTACSKLPPPANMGINTHKRALTTFSILKAQCFFFFPPSKILLLFFFLPPPPTDEGKKHSFPPPPPPPHRPFGSYLQRFQRVEAGYGKAIDQVLFLGAGLAAAAARGPRGAGGGRGAARGRAVLGAVLLAGARLLLGARRGALVAGVAGRRLPPPHAVPLRPRPPALPDFPIHFRRGGKAKIK